MHYSNMAIHNSIMDIHNKKIYWQLATHHVITIIISLIIIIIIHHHHHLHQHFETLDMSMSFYTHIVFTLSIRYLTQYDRKKIKICSDTNSQQTHHMPSHVALKTIIQNNETVCSPCLSENLNDISCVNTGWVTFVMVVCVLGISANHPINLPRKQLINAISKLIDPMDYVYGPSTWWSYTYIFSVIFTMPCISQIYIENNLVITRYNFSN